MLALEVLLAPEAPEAASDGTTQALGSRDERPIVVDLMCRLLMVSCLFEPTAAAAELGLQTGPEGLTHVRVDEGVKR